MFSSVYSVLLLLACASARVTATQAPACPDIAIFVLDDIAAADLALYGGPVSMPNLEALAGGGVRFDRCYANPTCSPSRRSMLTGTWWIKESGEPCGLPEAGFTPELTCEFLPEALPSHASGIVGKWHLGGEPSGGPWELAPISHGFDYWTAGMGANVGNCAGTNYGTWERVNSSAGFYSSGVIMAYEPVAVRDAFNLGWNATASPKLAYVCGNLAHGPFHVPPSPLYTGLPPGSQRGRFEAMIEAEDFLLGQMLAQVDLLTTLVIVVADNGTPQSVAPDPLRAKTTTYERGVRVPLVIAGAGVLDQGRVSDDLVHVVDLWATAIEAGGGTAPGGSPVPIRSVSLGPILRNELHAPPHLMVLVGHHWGSVGERGDRAAVSVTEVKLRQVDLDGDLVVDTEELYDLAADPTELTNLIGSPAYAAEETALRAFIVAESP